MAQSSPAVGQLALYPGSFDPIHNGHIDVVEQACELFAKVLVVAMFNPSKQGGTFAVERRVALIRQTLGHLPAVSVQSFGGLAVQAAQTFGANFLVKGLRNSGDFEIEQQMAQTNFAAAGVRTVFLPCRADLVYMSSRFIREISHYGGDVSTMVPAPVCEALDELRTASNSSDIAAGATTKATT